MESNYQKDSSLKTDEQKILSILIYWDIFDYPLTKKEIYERGKIAEKDLDQGLTNLVITNKVFLIEGFYSLRNNINQIKTRKERNKLAIDSIDKAKSMVKIMAYFPYIRGIFLSGSISKNCMDKNSDIDYFIVTEVKRVWIVRLTCFLFRKFILLNKTKYFCVNFLLDNEHLEISNKSMYTAIEVKTLMPLFGYSYYENMLNNNLWTNNYFPNYPVSENVDVYNSQLFVQKVLEKLLNNRIGDWLDSWVLRKSIKMRKNKVASKYFENPDLYINFQSHIAKDHVNENYPNVIKEYSRKIKEYQLVK